MISFINEYFRKKAQEEIEKNLNLWIETGLIPKPIEKNKEEALKTVKESLAFYKKINYIDLRQNLIMIILAIYLILTTYFYISNQKFDLSEFINYASQSSFIAFLLLFFQNLISLLINIVNFKVNESDINYISKEYHKVIFYFTISLLSYFLFYPDINFLIDKYYYIFYCISFITLFDNSPKFIKNLKEHITYKYALKTIKEELAKESIKVKETKSEV